MTGNHLRIFQHFPKGTVCPLCGADKDEETVLVPIQGTEDGVICETLPCHVICVLTRVEFTIDRKLMYVVPKEVIK